VSDVIQIVSVVVAVLIGYGLGIRHCKQAVRDAVEQLRERQ